MNGMAGRNPVKMKKDVENVRLVKDMSKGECSVLKMAVEVWYEEVWTVYGKLEEEHAIANCRGHPTGETR